MRHSRLLVLCFIGLMSISGCTVEQNPSVEAVSVQTEEKPILKIWTYTDEFLTEIASFEQAYGCEVDYEFMDANGFARMIDARIRDGEKPDVIISDYESMMSDALEKHIRPLNTFARDHKIESLLHKDMLDLSYDASNTMRGLSYHMTPVVIFYRRSLAKEVLGTDAPEQIREHFLSMESMYALGRMLKEHEIGLVPDPYALRHFMPLPADDGEEKLDLESWRAYLTTLNALKRNKLTPFYVEWSKEWFAGMQKEDVFSYVLPSWALSQILYMATPETAGDWGMVQGPYSTQWGGTWLSLTHSGEEQELANQFLEYMLLDEDHQNQWLANTYHVSSHLNIQKKQTYPEGNAFLGGQDYHQTLGDILSQGLASRPKDPVYEDLIIRYINDEFHTIDEVLLLIEDQQ